LIEDAIMVFPCCFAEFKPEHQRVIDLRQRPEKPMACALQIAKQADYSPKQGPIGPSSTPLGPG
jgi:hypothetical protein